MTLRILCCVLSLTAGVGANAQVCSGGTNGGMDATGNDCNDAASVSVASPANENRREAMAAYRMGDFKRAAALFRTAADEGDLRSAETLAMMQRYGSAVFGAGFVADAKMARHWEAHVAAAKARTRLALETTR